MIGLMALWLQWINEKRKAKISSLAATAETDLDRLEQDLMESDEDDAVELPSDRYQYRMATTFPRTGADDEERRAGLYYQWQREKY